MLEMQSANQGISGSAEHKTSIDQEADETNASKSSRMIGKKEGETGASASYEENIELKAMTWDALESK